MTSPTSQEFESFVPVYDSIPEDWEEARQFLVENLKMIANSINVRSIGFLLDEELLTGEQFIPTAAMSGPNSSNSQQLRSVLRKVVDVSPLIAGLNPPFLHGILFDVNFTLIDLWVCGTNSATFTALRINGNDVVMSATTLTITSPQAFDRAFAFCSYIQEI
jgi:hypothetical protein